MDFKLTSEAFEEGGLIPAKYTCDGENVSPPLGWSAVPQSTQSLALICDDPDAPSGTWVHWVLYNIPANLTSLHEHIPARSSLDQGMMQGINDFRETGYGGPCPPGGTHRYFFKLYALDTRLELAERLTKDQLLEAIEDHILAEARLMGRYHRR